jgi:hypothetical protein
VERRDLAETDFQPSDQMDCRPLIGDGYFCERLVVFTPDLPRKSTPEGF